MDLFGHAQGPSPNESSERGHMWDELVGIQQYWCCTDYLNIVHILSERSRGSQLTPVTNKSLGLLRIII